MRLPRHLLVLLVSVFSGYAVAGTGARVIPLDASAWAGSSVNVVAGNRQPVVTDSVHQYAGYYDADGTLVLARRRLGEDVWERLRTSHRGDVANAHNSVSLGVDGAGHLHVAWNHHNVPLNYARGLAPGGLELGPPQAMVGRDESRVTYPQFLRLPDGELLFHYRQGGSGDGYSVLNRFVPSTGAWERVVDRLLDGEGRRSAYWDLVLDGRGTLHLAWNWRETPDVATNQDLCYARSSDGGRTWTRSDGTPLSLPLTAANAEIAWAIPQRSNLMNPPAVGADGRGRPFIASYWSPAPGATPRYHLVFHDGTTWRQVPGPEAGRPFSLGGHGTRRPPLSRAALLVEPSRWGLHVHLVYRDDARGGRIVAASHRLSDAEPRWTERFLSPEGMGAWEPVFDPGLWERMRQAHFLVQHVSQLDGNDATGDRWQEPTPLSLLVWYPDWERHQGEAPTEAPPPAPTLDAPLRADAVAELGQRVANWQWEHFAAMERYNRRGWHWAPFYIGNLEFARATDNESLVTRMRDQAEAMEWLPAARIYHADDHCVIQAYHTLWERYREEDMLAPSIARFEEILANPSPVSLDWDSHRTLDRWSWCDALFMAPTAWLMLGEVTGDPRYLEFMNREWWATTERLYRTHLGLYFRDESYLDVREPNGRTIHWARGNGWVIAGLARVLDRFPPEHPDHPRYLRLYREMCATFLREQQPDGLWRPGLLDAEAHPARETSGTSFITFGLAWGVNRGLLDRDETLPAIRRAWNALAECVTPDGKLEHVQPVGAAPHGFPPDHTEPFAVGAFLLAASEVLGLAE
jgi:rhamnogalacturonyl hydrolase YesR